MCKQQSLVVLLLLFSQTTSENHNYFEYNDCPEKCIDKNISSTITPNDTNDYIKICITNDQMCEQEASTNTVCLRPDNPPVGGESIWEKYKQKYHPDVKTTTTEAPYIPNDKRWRYWLEGAITGITVTIIVTIAIITKLIRRFGTDAETQHIINNTEEQNNDELEHA